MKTLTTFTEGKLFGPLVRFSVPLLLAMFLQGMYGAVDLVIIGQFSDAAGVSAVSTGSHIIQTVTGVIIGLTAGSSILIAQYIGAKKPGEAARTLGTSVWMFGILALVVTAVLLLFARQLVTLMQAPAQAHRQTVQYVMVCGSGAFFIVAYNVISSILRGMGDSKSPLLFVAVACVVNVIGDLALVAGLAMGAMGAAIATVFAQGVSVVLALLYLRRRGLPFAFSRAQLALDKATAMRILKLGAPLALMDALTSVSFLVVTAILNTMGVIASAGIGVAEKLVVFMTLVPSAFMNAISTFVAQNIGAGKPGRARRAMGYGMMISLGVGVVMFLLSFFRGELLAAFFTNDEAVIIAAADYLKAYALDCILAAAVLSLIGYLNGCGHTVFVMLQGLIAGFGVRIPYSYFASKAPGATMFSIGLATPVATLAGVVLCAGFFLYLNGKRARDGAGINIVDTV